MKHASRLAAAPVQLTSLPSLNRSSLNNVIYFPAFLGASDQQALTTPRLLKVFRPPWLHPGNPHPVGCATFPSSSQGIMNPESSPEPWPAPKAPRVPSTPLCSGSQGHKAWCDAVSRLQKSMQPEASLQRIILL